MKTGRNFIWMIMSVIGIMVSFSASAQDLLIKVTGDTLKVTVQEVLPDEIKYTYFGEKITYLEKKANIHAIIFKNGRVEELNPLQTSTGITNSSPSGTGFYKEVPDCEGTGNDTRRSDITYDLAAFNALGLDLSKYDWSNKSVNCDINTAAFNWKKEKQMRMLAPLSLSLGVTLLGSGIVTEATADVGGGLVFLGLVGAGVSIPLFVSGSKAKKEFNAKVGRVLEYYRSQGL